MDDSKLATELEVKPNVGIAAELRRLARLLESPRELNDCTDPPGIVFDVADGRPKSSSENYLLTEAIGEQNPTKRTRPAPPDTRLVQNIIKSRDDRARFFPEKLFADPAWDMILDLLIATSEYKSVSVTSLCTASKVPHTTALRWISMMVNEGLFDRIEDPVDGRRAFISLSANGLTAAVNYFDFVRKRNILAG